MIGIRTSHSTGSSRSRRTATTTRSSSVVDDRALIPSTSQPLRTLDDVRDQVAQEIAINMVAKAKIVDGVRTSVRLVMSKTEDEYFQGMIAGKLAHQLALHAYIFAIGTVSQNTPMQSPTATPTTTLTNIQTTSTLIILASDYDLLQRAVLLASSKFLGRVFSSYTSTTTIDWVATIQDLGAPPYDYHDTDALWDILSKAARKPMDPLLAPPQSKGIYQRLSEARARLQRITPLQAYRELLDTTPTGAGLGTPTFLVDIRPQVERDREGGVQGALIVDRGELEWKFDPRCSVVGEQGRLAIADRYDLRVILICMDGRSSSLAADSLQELGLLNATDIIGGFEEWKETGLPVASPLPTPVSPVDHRESMRSYASLAGSMV